MPRLLCCVSILYEVNGGRVNPKMFAPLFLSNALCTHSRCVEMSFFFRLIILCCLEIAELKKENMKSQAELEMCFNYLSFTTDHDYIAVLLLFYPVFSGDFLLFLFTSWTKTHYCLFGPGLTDHPSLSPFLCGRFWSLFSRV